ncbi:MAG: carboxypeptidase-like regulatory domain-containing protein, partial [Planctomycetes bacterium]|nr:carboxypeptidase-like regulatory domain-containing protein [Planctomycetota bacterium]
MRRHTLTAGAVIFLAAMAWLTFTLMSLSDQSLPDENSWEDSGIGIDIITHEYDEAAGLTEADPGEGPLLQEKERINPAVPEEMNRFRIVALNLEDESPIEGVRITVQDWDTSTFFAEEITDANGCAEFDLRHVEKVRYFYVTGFKLGYTLEETWLKSEDTADELYLTPGTPLFGRVILASSGCPVEGAVIELDQDDIWYPEKCIKSDREGRFVIPAVLDRWPFNIEATLDGYATAKKVNQTLSPGEEMVFVLGGVGVFEGCVRGPGREAVAGAEVWVKKPNAYSWEIDGRAHTGPDGRYRIVGFPVPETYVVYAMAEECDFALGQSPPLLVADALNPVRADLSLKPQKTALTVQVVDEQGAPIEKASVEICDSVWQLTQRNVGPDCESNYGKTNEQGLCTIAPMEPGDYRVCVGWVYGVSYHRSITLEKDRHVELRMVLPTGMEMTGTVWDPGGMPVSGLTVSFWLPEIDRDHSPYVPKRMWDNEEQGLRIAQTSTDDQGFFRFTRLPLECGTLKLGNRYAIDYKTLTYGALTVEGVSPEDGPLEITLPPPATIKGRLVPPPPPGGTRLTLWINHSGGIVDNFEPREDGGFEIKTPLTDTSFNLTFEVDNCLPI